VNLCVSEKNYDKVSYCQALCIGGGLVNTLC